MHLLSLLLLSVVVFQCQAHDEEEEERLRGLPARSVCSAAMSVVEDTISHVSDVLSKISIDGIPLLPENSNHPSLIRVAEKRIKKSSFHQEFIDQNAPTQVVQMHLTNELAEQTIADLKTVREIQAKINDIADRHASDGLNYHPFSIQFDPAVLFVPGCIEFMEDNRATVKKWFPEVHTCFCNAFTVAKNSKNQLGFHHASSLGFTNPHFSKRKLYSPDKHMSFHTALSETNSSTSPLVMFDGLVPAVFDRGYFMSSISNASSWRPDIVEIFRLAAIGDPKIPFHMVYDNYQFMAAAYYAMQNCPDQDKSSLGTYWNLKRGEALFFNNYRMHSDHGFGKKDYDRHTLDLRCFSKVEVPFPFSDEKDMFDVMLPQLSLVQDAAVECMLRLFDYTDENDFFQFISGEQGQKPLSYSLGSVLFGWVNPGENGLLSSSMLDGMRKHGKRVRKMYSDQSLNFSSFESCIQERKEDLHGEGPSDLKEVVMTFLHYEKSMPQLAKFIVFVARAGLGMWGERFAMLTLCFCSLVILSLRLVGAKPLKKVHID